VSDEIIPTLSKYIAAEILKQPDRVIGPDEVLLSSGLIDSFHLVDLGLYVEDTFGVRIDDTELNASTFDTLNQLAALIRSRK
jgi:acyl carrier protein